MSTQAAQAATGSHVRLGAALYRSFFIGERLSGAVMHGVPFVGRMHKLLAAGGALVHGDWLRN